MTQVPVFNLTSSNLGFDNEEEFEEALAKKGNSKFFDTPGNYDLVVTDAAFSPNKDTGSIFCKGDETWLSVKLTLSAEDGRSINDWMKVPTQTLTYGPKKYDFMIKDFRKFLQGIGETGAFNEIIKQAAKHFKDPTKLIGQRINADLGYKADYVTNTPDGSFVIVVKGKPLQEDGADVKLPDRASAIQHAKSLGIEPGFMNVLKYTPKKSVKAAKAVANDW